MDVGGCVAVVGPAGIGKTTLVRAAVADRPHRIGGGLSMLVQRPYAALEAALRLRLDGDPDQVADEVLRHVDEVLVVEDLHWVHDLTVEVLERIVGHVAVVVTARPELGDAAAALVETGKRIDLEPLDGVAADRVARQLHPDLGAAERERLVEAAAGNPLLIERLVGGDQQVSPTLEAAMVERLGALDGGERRTLGLLALLGRPAPPAFVDAPATGWSDLLMAHDGGEVGFRHAALAHGVVALLDDDERRTLHGVLGDRLDGTEGASHDFAAGNARRAAARATTAARCASGVERADALRLAADATDVLGGDSGPLRASAAGAYVDAGRWQDAITQADLVGDATDSAVAADAQLQRGRAQWNAGAVDAARASFERAAALAGGLDAERETRIAVERAYLEVRDRQPGSSDLARDAVALAEQVGIPIEAVRARSNLGAAQLYDGDPRWETTLRSVLADARAAGDHELEAATAYHLVSGLGFHGRSVESLAVGTTHLSRTRTAGLGRWTVLFEVAGLMQRAVMTVDPTAVVADSDRLLAANRLFRNRFQLHLTKVLGLLDLGRFDEARSAVAVMESEAGDAPEPAVALAAAQAELAWHSDDADLARQALRTGRSVRDAYFGIHVLTERTAGHLVAGEPELPTNSMPTWWPALHELEGLRLRASGDEAGAAREFQRAADEWERTNIRRWAVRAGLAAVDAQAGERSAPARRRRYLDMARAAGLVGTLRRLGAAVHPSLTATEEHVLRLVATGATTKAIGTELGIAPATVDQHVEAARQKLGAATRIEAAAMVAG